MIKKKMIKKKLKNQNKQIKIKLNQKKRLKQKKFQKIRAKYKIKPYNLIKIKIFQNFIIQIKQIYKHQEFYIKNSNLIIHLNLIL